MAGCTGLRIYVAVVFALFALALLAWHACALHAHPGAPGTAGVTAFTAIAGGVVVCVIIDMRVFQCFIPGIALFEKTTKTQAGQGINAPRVGYLASDQFNRYRPEISHTAQDL